jgi:hypothetical protein
MCQVTCVSPFVSCILTKRRSTACGSAGTWLISIARYADIIEHTACAMSSFELPFCPDLVCPADSRVLGYPFAELPNKTSEVKGIRGFAPTRVTQWPPPGTVLGQDSTTSVLITATDASKNKTLQCVWRVTVPPLVVIGEVRQRLEIGTYNSTANITLNEVLKQVGAGAYTGSLFKMSSKTADGYKGDGARQQARPKPKSSGPTDGQVTIRENQTRSSNIFEYPLPVELDLARDAIANITLETEVLGNRQLNNNTVKLLGQIASYW